MNNLLIIYNQSVREECQCFGWTFARVINRQDFYYILKVMGNPDL